MTTGQHPQLLKHHHCLHSLLGTSHTAQHAMTTLGGAGGEGWAGGSANTAV
jgi:hypothetical protein